MGGIIGGAERSAKPHKKQLKISTDSPQNHDIQVTGGSFRGVLLKNKVLSTGYQKVTAVRRKQDVLFALISLTALCGMQDL